MINMEIRKWIVRFLLVIPLLSSIYCVLSVFGSSQSKLCKWFQIIWFILAVLMSETVIEFPEMLLTKEPPAKEFKPLKGRFSILIQICHYLSFLLLQSYHLFVYSFLLTYWHSYFAHLPIIVLAAKTVATGKYPNLSQFFNRVNQIFTGLLMICICAQGDNLCGVFGAILMLFCFFYVKKPTGKMHLDEVYWFLIAIYFSIVVHSYAIYSMIESPNVFANPSVELWS